MKLLVSRGGVCYLVGACSSPWVYEFWFFAQILYWVDNNPQFTRFMERVSNLRQKTRSATADPVTGYGPYRHLKDLIVAEDAKVVDHEGSTGKAFSARWTGKEARKIVPRLHH